jgi:hypothetical protein
LDHGALAICNSQLLSSEYLRIVPNSEWVLGFVHEFLAEVCCCFLEELIASILKDGLEILTCAEIFKILSLALLF